MYMCVFFFFFSSRRRHTRFDCDWSSDVCSSDLLDAARRYAQIAPAAPHAQHMPSHIFIRLGLWDETIAANQRSLEAGIAYARAQQLKGVAPEQFHALDYMVYGHLQEGRDSAARRAVVTGLGR